MTTHIPDLVSPWVPITNKCDLKHLGKLAEELGECGAAVARCIIQGVASVEPVTLKPNHQWLEDEIADVLANIDLCISHFELDPGIIAIRKERKKKMLSDWHNLLA